MKKTNQDDVCETYTKVVCRDPKHQPPNMIHLSIGTYVHTCPSCNMTKAFRVESARLNDE